MLSGSSEFWAAFPPACVNLQLDTSSFTCFSLGYPPLPLPLLHQPGNKLSEIKGLFHFLLSEYPKARTPALQLCSLVCPVPSSSHRAHPGPASPGEQVAGGRGWSRCSQSVGGRHFPPVQCPSRRRDLLWGNGWRTALFELLISYYFFSPFSSLCLSLFPYLSPPFPLYLLFFPLSFRHFCILSFSSFYIFPFLPSPLFYSLSHKSTTITGYSLGKV